MNFIIWLCYCPQSLTAKDLLQTCWYFRVWLRFVRIWDGITPKLNPCKSMIRFLFPNLLKSHWKQIHGVLKVLISTKFKHECTCVIVLNLPMFAWMAAATSWQSNRPCHAGQIDHHSKTQKPRRSTEGGGRCLSLFSPRLLKNVQSYSQRGFVPAPSWWKSFQTGSEGQMWGELTSFCPPPRALHSPWEL